MNQEHKFELIATDFIEFAIVEKEFQQTVADDELRAKLALEIKGLKRYLEEQ